MFYPPPTWDASGLQTSGSHRKRGTLSRSLGNADLLRPLKELQEIIYNLMSFIYYSFMYIFNLCAKSLYKYLMQSLTNKPINQENKQAIKIV